MLTCTNRVNQSVVKVVGLLSDVTTQTCSVVSFSELKELIPIAKRIVTRVTELIALDPFCIAMEHDSH